MIPPKILPIRPKILPIRTAISSKSKDFLKRWECSKCGKDFDDYNKLMVVKFSNEGYFSKLCHLCFRTSESVSARAETHHSIDFNCSLEEFIKRSHTDWMAKTFPGVDYGRID